MMSATDASSGIRSIISMTSVFVISLLAVSTGPPTYNPIAGCSRGRRQATTHPRTSRSGAPCLTESGWPRCAVQNGMSLPSAPCQAQAPDPRATGLASGSAPRAVSVERTDNRTTDRHYQTHKALHIQIPHFQCVLLDELAAGFDFFAHQDPEHVVGGAGVVHADLQQRAVLGVERRFPEFFRVHFA